MKKIILFIFAISLLSIYSCKKEGKISENSSINAASEEKTDLSATEFSEKLKQTNDAVILDVRTPGEFENGHIANAKNIDINGNFEAEITKLDKSKPTFVYCLSGARSSAALDILKDAGFKKIYHLEGGMMSWRSANLPETTENAIKSEGLTKEKFAKLTKSDKIVLVDFYAEWCAPCKKMEPYLNEISETMKDKVKVVRINVDENANLSKELKIDAIPVLHIYKNGTLEWQNQGFVPKEEVVKHLQ